MEKAITHAYLNRIPPHTPFRHRGRIIKRPNLAHNAKITLLEEGNQAIESTGVLLIF